MYKVLTILIVSAALLVCGGCKKEEKKKQKGYLETVASAKDMAQHSAVGQNCKAIEASLKMYEAENGKYPESLAQLDLDTRAFVGADGKTPLVYMKPVESAPPATIILYDPVGCNGEHYVITASGVTLMTRKDLKVMIGL